MIKALTDSLRLPFRSTFAAMLPGISSKETWEREYANGAWSRLSSDDDAGRYAILLGHMVRREASSVLDVGCGPGRLLDFLARGPLTAYTGLDISEEAVRAAQKGQKFADATFLASTAEAYTPDRKFDLIIFNEVMFYLQDPRALLTRYHGYLNDGGQLLVSMMDCPYARFLWRRIGRSFETTEATKVTKGYVSWSIRALRPKAG